MVSYTLGIPKDSPIGGVSTLYSRSPEGSGESSSEQPEVWDELEEW